MDEERHSRRSNFLIAWYDVLWRNVDRSMTGMWQVLAPITVVGTAWAAIHGRYVPLWLAGVAVLLVSTWALNLTIDLNSWHRRNLFFLTAVEREFLHDTDYGRVIPKAYARPPTKWIRFYFVHGIVFLLLLIASMIYVCAVAIERCETWTIYVFAAVLVLAIGYTLWHFVDDFKSARKTHEELFPASNES